MANGATENGHGNPQFRIELGIFVLGLDSVNERFPSPLINIVR